MNPLITQGLVDTFDKAFQQEKPQKLHRIKWRGKFIRLRDNKTAWTTSGAAKLAFRHNFKYNYDFRGALIQIFDVPLPTHITTWTGNQYYFNMTNEQYTKVIKSLIDEKLLEFVETEGL